MDLYPHDIIKWLIYCIKWLKLFFKGDLMEGKLEFLFYTSYEDLSKPPHPHKHNCYELVYYIKGKGKSTIGAIDHNYFDGNIAIIKPGIFHSETHFEATEVIYIGFSYDNSTIKLNNALLKDTPSKNILGILYKMKSEIINKNYYYELKLNALLKEIIIELARLNEKSEVGNEWLNYVLNFINENFYHDIDLNTLAEISGYSYHRFRHLFKENFGLSPSKYIISKRISHAKYLLQNTTLSISSIAIESGFYDNCQFSNLFKKYVGACPSGYRNNKGCFSSSE